MFAYGISEHDGAAVAAAFGGPVRVVADGPDLVRAVHAEPGQPAAVLGPAVPHRQVLRLTAQVRAARPETLVVLLRPAVNRLERQLARDAGVDALLPAGDLAAAGRSCREFVDARTTAGRGRVVTVFAGKGGCGTTTLAVNLAVALAEDRGRQVCLVDLDLRTGDLAVRLGLQPLQTIASATPMHRHGTADLVAAVVTPFRPRLDCVLAPVRPGEAERLDVAAVETVLDALVHHYDVVVVDTPPAFTAPVLAALDRAEHHVLVTTPERPALHSLRRTMDTLDLLGHRKDARSVVFNRSDAGAGLAAADVERTLRAPIAAHVPSSRDVPVSINSCLPLMARIPYHPVSSAIRRFAVARLTSPASASPVAFGGAVT